MKRTTTLYTSNSVYEVNWEENVVQEKRLGKQPIQFAYSSDIEIGKPAQFFLGNDKTITTGVVEHMIDTPKKTIEEIR